MAGRRQAHLIETGRLIVDPIEDLTCDRCRAYHPGVPIHAAVVRTDVWILVAGLCSVCHAEAMAHGRHLVTTPARGRGVS